MISQATSDYLGTVEEIVREAYTKWVAVIGGKPIPMQADYAALIDAGTVWLLDSMDGLIVLVDEADGDTGGGVLLIENVAVRPSAQGKGLGRQLLTFAEEQARTRGLTALRLYTNEKMTSNIALYLAFGYRETGREVINGRHVVHMRKDLGT
nr:GNAT family N-acetyltransferase [Kibdelosporangium sp. MJ126-NF4]CEL20212.1 Histone acetyltransferase HPA2 and related acetyltransferases [Kibdelosporangium sp. MJ126-NF4]CTQ97437.1 Histone acetyltransferase HPA2 and related acetyltransferases [Kibdelosporangium sp. MJ126-NF4]